MAKPIPHILVEADPELTEHIWRASQTKPLVLAPASNASWLQNEFDANGDPYLHRFPALDIIGHLLKGKHSEEYRHLLRVLAAASRKFKLDREPLRISVAGSHTSISNAITSGYQHEGGDLNYLIEEEFLPGMRRHRLLARLLGAALRKIPRVETPWLAPAYRSLRPKVDRTDADLVELAARARSDLDVLVFEHGEHEIQLSRPVSPLIYVRRRDEKGRKGDWQELGFVASREPYWTTDHLIGQFRALCKDEPNLEGVLVKVVGTRTSDYCPVDAPVVGTRTFDAAAGTNISAILLDREFGILRPFELKDPLLPPVYRVLTPPGGGNRSSRTSFGSICFTQVVCMAPSK